MHGRNIAIQQLRICLRHRTKRFLYLCSEFSLLAVLEVILSYQSSVVQYLEVFVRNAADIIAL